MKTKGGINKRYQSISKNMYFKKLNIQICITKFLDVRNQILVKFKFMKKGLVSFLKCKVTCITFYSAVLIIWNL